MLSLALAFGVAAPLLPQTARAQSQDDLERARQQFRQGLSLEAAGDWAAALAKFVEVGKVRLTPQVRFHSARCNEQLGRLNEALGEYRLAEYEAGQQGLREQAEISQARQALETRVPKLIIRRGENAAAAKIELDGVELGEPQIGQPVNVDPGPHTVVAKLGADRQVEQSPTVKEGETAEVVMNAPAVATSPVTNTTADTGTAGADTHAKSHPSVLPWVVGGVGVASLVTSGVFFGLRAGAISDLDKGCKGNICPKSLQGTQDDGKLYTTLSYVTLGVGIAGVGVATYLFIAGSGKQKEQASLPVDVAMLPGGGFVTVRGSL